MYADKVVSKSLIYNTHAVAALFAGAFVVFYLIDFSDTAAANLLPAAGAQITLALLLASAFVGNILLIDTLPKHIQVYLVWAELAMLAAAFFLIFNLDFAFIREKAWFMISRGVTTTLYVSAIAIVIAFVIAIFGAIAKLSGNSFVFAIASFYTSLFRGLPLLMQLYLIYLGLPQLGYVVTAVPAGITALALCYGAYMTEIFRAGIESIHSGQWEAARSMGLKFPAIMRLIILPQAVPLIIPPTGNQFIAMLKDSSLVSVIGVWELMFLSRKLGAKTFQHLEMLITAAVLYWILTIVLEVAQARLEQYYRRRVR